MIKKQKEQNKGENERKEDNIYIPVLVLKNVLKEQNEKKCVSSFDFYNKS